MGRFFRKISLVFCFAALFCWAGNDEEFFLRGNQLYEKHEYAEALLSYDKIAKKGRAVLYNMGNCYYYNNNYPYALLYWLRAEKGATPQEMSAIAYNKHTLFEQMKKSEKSSLLSSLIAVFTFFMTYFSLLGLQCLVLLCWALLVISFFINGYSKKIVSCFALTLFICFGVTLYRYCEARRTTVGVVVAKAPLVFIGPDKRFQALGSLSSADQVIIKEIREGWYKVQSSDKIGWVEATMIQAV